MSSSREKKQIPRVSAEILAKTSQCSKDFSCQKDLNAGLCPVESHVAETALFVKCLKQSDCNYQSTFGHGIVCNCPTRKEIYKKYKI